MPDTKISALTDGSPALSTDEIPAARAGANVRITAADIAALATSTPSDFQPAIVTNRYYTTQGLLGSAGLTPSADTLIAYPFWVSNDVVFNRASVVVDTGMASALLRAGIYEDNGSNAPGALLLDFGEYDVSSQPAEKTVSLTLSANTLYWLAYNSNDGGTYGAAIIGGTQNAGLISFVLGAGSAGAASPGIGYEKTQAYGALPDPFGTPDQEFNGQTVGIYLRKV
jgi:hypothetical protein